MDFTRPPGIRGRKKFNGIPEIAGAYLNFEFNKETK
jgi:hypothetical protein